MYSDLHCHITLKNFMRADQVNAWQTVPFDEKDQIKWSKSGNYTQSDLGTLAENRGKLICTALHPVERATQNNFIKRFINLFVSQFKGKIVKDKIRQPYFNTLNEEYNYLAGQPEEHDGRRMRFIKDKADLDAHFNQADVNVMLSIEGCHAFESEEHNRSGEKEYEESILNNVDAVKNWDHRILFVTATHMAWNYLTGQAFPFPFPALLKLFFRKNFLPPENGITPLGWKVFRKLLDSSGRHGKPVLIDVKHMHPEARYEYYTFLKEPDNNYKHPIVASHIAAAGIPDLAGLLKLKDRPGEAKASLKHYPYKINFCDEEFRIIHNSEGLIGVSFDERILGANSKSYSWTIDHNKKLLSRDPGLTEARENLDSVYIEMLLDNMTRIVKAIGSPEGWKTICMGTDFDGIINPIDTCPTAGYFDDLEDKLVDRLPGYLQDNDLSGLLNGLDPEKVIRDFMYDNLREFVERNI